MDDEEGRRRRHVNVFYNDVDEHSVEDRDLPATDRDEILIIQSVSGGSDSASAALRRLSLKEVP